MDIERSDNEAWEKKIEGLQHKIIDLGKDVNDSQPLNKLIKEKDEEIMILKKKLNIPKTKHV